MHKKINYGTEIKIACGLKHGVAVSETGVLYTWGSNAYGQLSSSDATVDNPNTAQERSSIKSMGGRTLSVACQEYSTFAIISTKPQDGKNDNEPEKPILFAWGKNEGQLLGLGSSSVSN